MNLGSKLDQGKDKYMCQAKKQMSNHPLKYTAGSNMSWESKSAGKAKMLGRQRC